MGKGKEKTIRRDMENFRILNEWRNSFNVANAALKDILKMQEDLMYKSLNAIENLELLNDIKILEDAVEKKFNVANETKEQTDVIKIVNKALVKSIKIKEKINNNLAYIKDYKEKIKIFREEVLIVGGGGNDKKRKGFKNSYHEIQRKK